MSRHAIEPRGLNLQDALHYIGVSTAWFSKRKDDLIKKLKFPTPHPITGRYDRKLIDQWMDETGGIKSLEKQEEEELLRRIENGDI